MRTAAPPKAAPSRRVPLMGPRKTRFGGCKRVFKRRTRSIKGRVFCIAGLRFWEPRSGRGATALAKRLPKLGCLTIPRVGYDSPRGSAIRKGKRLGNAIRFASARAALAAAICAAAVGGAFAASDDKPKTPMPPWSIQFPFDQTFSLRELNGKPVPDGLDVSLKIDGSQRGTGFTGCNSWSATIYPTQGQKLAVGPPALTKKTCPKDIMTIESGFLSALFGQPAWDLVNGELIIKGPRGSLKLVRSL